MELSFHLTIIEYLRCSKKNKHAVIRGKGMIIIIVIIICICIISLSALDTYYE